MKYLLDTSVCVDALRGRHGVATRLAQVAPSDVAFSTVTRYELLVGTRKCRQPKTEQRKVEKLLDLMHEIVFTRRSAEHAAQIRTDLESGGHVIGPYDLLLAGQALEHDLVLVSSNLQEFARVPGLRCESWR